ncbi:MAG: endonuclease VIII, partial [Eubacterium sp.]
MLEIPESITVAEQLNDVIKGKVVQNVYPAGSPHKFAFYYESPEDYQILLKGKQVGEAKAIAGYVEIEVGDARLLFGDGVHIRYYEEGERLPQKHQLHIEFEDYS